MSNTHPERSMLVKQSNAHPMDQNEYIYILLQLKSDNAYLSTFTEEKNSKYATKRNKTSEKCEEIHKLRWGNKALMLAVF